MIGIMWEYNVKPEAESRFADEYGGKGKWAEFFGKSEHHVSTSCYVKLPEHGVYMTIDLWSSKRDYDEFIAENKEEYEKIDLACATLTLSERFVCTFEAITEL